MMRLVDVSGGGALLTAIYDAVLRDAFTADELDPYDTLNRSLSEGSAVVTALVDEQDRPLGAAVGEWSPDCGVLLLAHLAVRRDSRSGGLGTLLMSRVLGSWRTRFQPWITLVEMKHPSAHAREPDHGDPSARLRFYARHGARALDVPYFQPALGPGKSRVYGMILAALHVEPQGAGERAGTVSAELLHAFITAYFESTEGCIATDDATGSLFRAIEETGAVTLLSLDDPSALLISRGPT